MGYQRQIPGGPFVNERGFAQRQIPGGAFLNERALQFARPERCADPRRNRGKSRRCRPQLDSEKARMAGAVEAVCRESQRANIRSLPLDVPR